MLASLRPSSSTHVRLPCLYRRILPIVVRSLATRSTSNEDDDDEDTSDLIPRRRGQEDPLSATPHAWLEGDGMKYRDPKNGPNWLGGNVPFPMNPTFSPPPPLPNNLRDKIYLKYMLDPISNNIRALSSEFGISHKRIDAILRLKGLEQSWLQKKPLQTGFQIEMERILAVDSNWYLSKHAAREVSAADIQDEVEGKDHARERYQRHFWEPVVEGEAPTVPISLEQAKEDARKARQAVIKAKSNPTLLSGGVKKSKILGGSPHVDLPASEAKPRTSKITFIDVKGKFIDVKGKLVDVDGELNPSGNRERKDQRHS